MLNSVGLQGPGVERWLRRRAARAASRTGRHGRGQHLGPHGRRVRRAADAAGRRARPRSSPSRSTCRARTSTTGPARDVRPATRRPPPRRSRPSSACRPSACGPSSRPTVADLVEVRRGARARRRRGGHAGQHRARAWPSTPTRAGPRLGGGGGGLSGPAIHPVAVRAVHDVHARAARPAASSVSAASPRPPTPSSCCWPAPTPCRSARPPSPTPGAVGARSPDDAATTVVPAPTARHAPSTELIGAVHAC